MSQIPEQTAIKLATQTLEAIDRATLARADDGMRPHLGASQIGKKCERALWYSFRWATEPKFSPRILRLFARGHREESNLTGLLESAGISVSTFDPKTGKQYHLGGAHFSGSCDGMADNVPEAPKTRHIVEYKTSGAKAFAKLKAEGVQKAKPEHYAQMQCYMHWSKLTRALYVCVNKDDDDLHIERVDYDKDAAIKLEHKAARIIFSDRIPEPISADPSWYECKFCEHHYACHGGKPVEKVNCRTCCHSTAKADGSWHCAKWDSAIPTEHQRTGCSSHVMHPDMVPWQLKHGHGEWSAVYVIAGQHVVNGEDGYSSAEILANPEFCASGAADEWKARFPGAKVVE